MSLRHIDVPEYFVELIDCLECIGDTGGATILTFWVVSVSIFCYQGRCHSKIWFQFEREVTFQDSFHEFVVSVELSIFEQL